MITNDTNKLIYDGNGVDTQFYVTFPFSGKEELKLFLHDIQNNSDSEITSNWDYNATNGKVIYPVAGSPIIAGFQIVILRNTAQTQEKNHLVRSFTSQDVEDMADKLTREVQDLNEKINRSIKFPVASTCETDAQSFINSINEAVETATSQATIASEQASISANKAEEAADSAAEAASVATQAAESANSSAQSAQDAAQNAASSSSSAADAASAYADIENWISIVEEMKDNEVYTYTAGTATTSYDGSLTVFPVENEFAVPINVFVNGQYKEIVTEYSEDKTNNIITFTTALNSGDKVNIVSNIAIANLESSGAISTAISTHNASSSAHSTEMAAKESISNKVTSLSGSSTNTQYPSAKAVYDELSLKANSSTVTTLVNAKLSLTGGTMTGDIVMAKNGSVVSGVQLLNENDAGYRISSTKDANNNNQLRLFDKSSGNGLFLNGTDSNKPYYFDGDSTSVRLLDATDKTELQSAKANTSLNNLTNGLANTICTTAATTTSTASAATPAVVIENYVDGTSWYRVWSDGWCEQGGVSPTIPGPSSATITLLKEMKDTNYFISLTNTNFAIGQAPGVSAPKTTTSFGVDYAGGDTSGIVYWEVKGYKAVEP